MISKTGIHAIRALVALSTLPADARLGAAALARSIGAPPNYLGKLLQLLARHGVVDSRKGPRGGFRLALPSRSIRLIDVVEPIDHVERRSVCLLEGIGCRDREPCAVHERWSALARDYLQLLTGTSIADLTALPNARSATARPRART